MNVVILLLVVLALTATLLHAIGKAVPLWLAVLLLGLAMLVQGLPGIR